MMNGIINSIPKPMEEAKERITFLLFIEDLKHEILCMSSLQYNQLPAPIMGESVFLEGAWSYDPHGHPECFIFSSIIHKNKI
jgi:hypothetical protein